MTINTTAGSQLVLTLGARALINRLWPLVNPLCPTRPFRTSSEQSQSTWPLLTACLLTPQARVSQLCTKDSQGQIILCCKGSIPASTHRTPAAPHPSCDNQTCLLTLPNVPGGQSHPLEATAPGQAPVSLTFSRTVSASTLACAPYSSPRNSLPSRQSKPFKRKCCDKSFHLDPPEASCHEGWNAGCLPSLPRPCPGLPVTALTSLPHSHSAYRAPFTLTHFLLLQHARYSPTSGPLHLLFPQPATLLPQITGRFTPLFYLYFFYLPWPA